MTQAKVWTVEKSLYTHVVDKKTRGKITLGEGALQRENQLIKKQVIFKGVW